MATKKKNLFENTESTTEPKADAMIKEQSEFELAKSVTFEKKTYTKLTMRRPKVRDMRLAQQLTDTAMGYELVLFSNLCDIPEGLMDELDEKDYRKMQEIYRSFLS